MLIRLYDDDARDLYIQLADEIIRLIAENQLNEGDELPSIRKLAASLQVNVKTVQAAYQKLADDGFILLRKKATALVDQQNFNEDAWLGRWASIMRRFQNEGRARKFTEEEIYELIERMLGKERTL